MESTKLTATEMRSLVDGWGGRGREALKDLASNVGAAIGGDLAARTSVGTVAAIGAVLQVGDGLVGPRYPWLQTALGKPGVGMVDAAIGISRFLKRKAKMAETSGG